MVSAATQEILAAFQALARALQDDDTAAFRALAVADQPAQVALFSANAKKVRAGSLSVRPRRVEQVEDVAEVTFELVAPDGRRVDEGRVVLSREDGPWKVRSL